VGILGVMQMNILANNQNALAKRMSTSTRIGRDLVDSLDRLPFDHPAFNANSSLTITDPGFVDFSNTDGLVLQTTPLASTDQPYTGAAPMIQRADGSDDLGVDRIYKVGWRVKNLMDPNDPTGVRVEAKMIAIIVRFAAPVGSGYKDMAFWTVKYNCGTVQGNGLKCVEI
jgi:hypothetical protein